MSFIAVPFCNLPFQDNLVPHRKRTSREISPDVPPIEEGEEQATPINHTPQKSISPDLRGSITNDEAALLRNDPRQAVSPPLLPPPNSYPNSPPEVTSDPCIDPPPEFSGNSALKFQPNGGVSYQLQREKEASVMSIDNDQAALIVNTNSNNNCNQNSDVIIAADPNVSDLSVTHDGAPKLRLRMQPNAIYIPSEASTVSHSDIPSVRYSSIESGFDGDNELENNSAWYISPEVSPRPSDGHEQQQQHVGERWQASSLQSQDGGYDRLPLLCGTSRQPIGKAPSSVTVPQSQTRTSHSRNSRSFDASDLLGVYTLPSEVASESQKAHRHIPTGGTSHAAASHARSQSQPEELIGVGPHLYGSGTSRGYRNPLTSKSPSHYPSHSAPTQVHPGVSRHPLRQEDRLEGRGNLRQPFFNRKPEHVKSEETVLRQPEPHPQSSHR